MFATLILWKTFFATFLLASLISITAPQHFALATWLLFTYTAWGRFLAIAFRKQHAAVVTKALTQNIETLFPTVVHARRLEETIRNRYWFVALAVWPFMLIGGLMALSFVAALFNVGPHVDPVVRAWNLTLTTVAGTDTSSALSIANVTVAIASSWVASIFGTWLHDHYLFGQMRRELREAKSSA